MGFGETWCQWIMFCVSIVWMSVLVNGTPAGFFPTYHCLRQGDPLLPLLFILVIEALSKLLVGAMHEGLLEGFAVGSLSRTPIGISHLLYADDVLIFCGVEVEQVGYLRYLLLYFEVVLGLWVNFRKSELIPVGEVDRLPILAAVLECKVLVLPVLYLGLPLGASFKHPTYFMSVHVIPVSVARRLEKFQRDFLRGGGEDEFRYHLGDWGQIYQSKKKWWNFGTGKGFGWVMGGRCSFGRTGGVVGFYWRNRFPLIFIIAVDREAMVASYMGDGGVVVWDVQLRRQVQDWEVTQLVEMWGFLYGLGITRVGQDVMVWNGAGAKGWFSVFILSGFGGGSGKGFSLKEYLGAGCSV
ncbi:uncharacterized protein LOC114268862 [Camellia sinensis]|uniref:uncharacterized protein LOC114268862 n=1 Tax=Camellia sinensis TaxID=4442 RepID=UPI001036BEA6|nr:uncharacterized protein LOC114268862 [Camellia sinensis]